MMPECTLLQVVRDCHNHNPRLQPDEFIPLRVRASSKVDDATVIGYLPRWFADHLTGKGIIASDVEFDEGKESVLLSWSKEGDLVTSAHITDTGSLGTKLSNLNETLRHDVHPILQQILGGWRNELYSIYGPARDATPLRKREVLFKLERAACALWGVATFGVHCTGYTKDYKVWVPRRAKTKSTWPSYLDNTVAGGISAGESQFESMVRECAEEAGLEDNFVRQNLKATGAISYFYKSSHGCCQPEVEYTYDILLPDYITPKPVDGEVESFQLVDFNEVMQRIQNLEFKPNSALVLIDFFIRHNLITSESEPDYLEIISLMHTDLGLPCP